MAKIVTVHGIGQQFSGDAIIHREWWPALISSLHLAGSDLEDQRELDCAFYGHLFRKPGTLVAADCFRAEDVGPEEAELLNLLWQAAVEVERQAVPSPDSYAKGETLARTPQIVQRALSAVSKSSFCVNLSHVALIGDLKQVVLYMNNRGIHEKVLEIVAEKITHNTRVIIGHSRPAPSAENIGAWPGGITRWTNIADKGDIVALEKKLARYFGNGVTDILVNNGPDPDHGERYLNDQGGR